MNGYKIIACDIDGTLLNDKLCISRENLDAIHALSEKGVQFVPATGRALSEMPEILENPDIRYIIYSNGTAILDKKSGKHILSCISEKSSGFVLDVISRYQSYYVAHRKGETYGELLDRKARDEFNVSFNVQELVDKYCNLAVDMKTALRTMDEVESYSVFFKHPEDKEACRKELMADTGINIVDSFDSNIEIFCAGAGKDTALMYLSDMLGVPIENIITIGDSGNDIAMTKAAGLGLAVGNSKKELTDVCDRVICSNNEHAIKFVLDEYFNT